MKKKLLLISNSKIYRGGYLNHVADEIVDFLKDIKEILFIPYALKYRDKYESLAKERFKQIGIRLSSIHRETYPQKAVGKAKAIFIGGGNTFRLLHEMYKSRILDAIKNRVENGMPYIGASAGANVACPTIKTTNDMSIVYPPSLHALNLIPFQINPHYIDSDSNSKHMGETREQRIKEFHEENNQTVVGLREGSWLRIENNQIFLEGKLGAKVFIKAKHPKEYKTSSSLNEVLRIDY